MAVESGFKVWERLFLIHDTNITECMCPVTCSVWRQSSDCDGQELYFHEALIPEEGKQITNQWTDAK